MKQRLTEKQRVMVIAGLSGADPRTVKKFLAGAPVKGSVVRERIEMAARQVTAMEGPQDQVMG